MDANGHKYVDLGLPSGTLWATCNVGASKPSNYGLYFQWGDTSGYTADQVGKDKQFALDYSDYKWGVSPNFTKYTTKGETLELGDDAAHVNMGGDWHMPTSEQIQELIANTTRKATTMDGINGITFTSKNDISKPSIFVPAAGLVLDGSVKYSGDECNVWSSMLNTGDVRYGQYLYSISDEDSLDDCDRSYGLSVRGVLG